MGKIGISRGNQQKDNALLQSFCTSRSVCSIGRGFRMDKYQGGQTSRWFQTQRSLRYLLRSLLILVLAMGLSSCMQYDLGIQFNHAIRGSIVQGIHLEDMGTVGDLNLQQWFQALEQEALALQGSTQHPSPQDLIIKVPFSNGGDLVQKFNQLFTPQESDFAADRFPLQAHLAITQKNALLAVYTELSLDVDLTQLAIATVEGDRLLSLDPLVQLRFDLETPWGVQWQSQAEGENTGQTQAGIPLQSGKVNHLQAAFWLPSPIGLGSVAIGLLVAAGQWLRKKLLAKPIPGIMDEGYANL